MCISSLFFFLLNCVPFCYDITVCLPKLLYTLEGPLGCFLLGAVLSKTMNIFAHVFWWPEVSHLLGICLGVELPVHEVGRCLAFGKFCHRVFQNGCINEHSYNQCESLKSSKFLPALDGVLYCISAQHCKSFSQLDFSILLLNVEFCNYSFNFQVFFHVLLEFFHSNVFLFHIFNCFLNLSDDVYKRYFCLSFQNYTWRDFPGGPVVKTSHFHCRGLEFDPWSEN